MVFHDKLWGLDFAHFLDSNMNWIPLEMIVHTATHNNQDIKKIITPKVVEKARQHFDCPDMDGVPLEISGGDGQKGIHWEKTVMGIDYMTAATQPH